MKRSTLNGNWLKKVWKSFLYWRADRALARFGKRKDVASGHRWYEAELRYKRAEGMLYSSGTLSTGRTVRSNHPTHYLVFANVFRLTRTGHVKKVDLTKPFDSVENP